MPRSAGGGGSREPVLVLGVLVAEALGVPVAGGTGWAHHHPSCPQNVVKMIAQNGPGAYLIRRALKGDGDFNNECSKQSHER